MPPTSNQPNPSTNSANRSTSGRFAARGRSAASSSKSKSVSWADKKKKKELTGKVIADKIKDGKLSHLAEHLESLPAQVSTVIEKFATSMLDLVLDIDLKSTPLARFGSMITKKDGEQVLYAPSCCRNDNPVTGSQLIKETNEYKTIVTDYDAILKTYHEAATALLKKSAELEVSTREKLLRDKVIEAILEIALNLVVAECTRVKMATPEAILLSKEVIAVIASKDYIASWTDAEWTVLKFGSLQASVNALRSYRNGRGISIGNSWMTASEETKAIAESVTNSLKNLFPKMSFDVWEKVRSENLLRKIDEELSVLNKNTEQGQLNENTAEQVAAQPTVPESILKSYVDEQFKMLRKEVRKNSSAGLKNQKSAAKSNGPNSAKSRKEQPKASAKSSKKRQRSNSPQKPSKKQKQQQDQQQQRKQKRKGSRKRAREEDQDDVPSGGRKSEGKDVRI